ncbi:amino acid permease [Dactylonectria estremocensis]|uniref:Amino acid permease n=1 Tax=Dactylonectria estremocensis TaxID=1079267 RepID=A0A9P9J2Z7_9HYPO|nr:amino acid permease [Dactylonectria estremocensis]
MDENRAPSEVDIKREMPDLHHSVSRPLKNLSDEERLAQLGHQQELSRQFSLPALGALCLCLMATWEALSTVIATALLAGGPPCLFFNYVLSFSCTICIVISLGEIASIYPTAGGQYHWVAALCPPSTKAAASWATGWISVGGQIVLTASAAFAAGLQAQALITVNDDTYVGTRWQGMLFYFAILAYSGVLNIWGMKAMPHVNLFSGILHVVAFVAITITLGVMAPKNTSSFVFTEFVNSSGWKSDGVSWLVGMQSAVYPFLGYDAACHLAEELPHAARNVPLAMVGSVVVNGVIGFIYVIVLLYCSSSLEALLTTPTGFPFMQIFLDATQSRAGATVMSLMIVLIATAATVAGVASTSRTLWAFARDKATPFDKTLSHVNPKLQVPVNSVILVLVLQVLLGLIYLGNATAFNAVLSMAIIGLYLSYILPIFYMTFYGRSTLRHSDYGPFRLPRFVGIAANGISMVWMTVVMIFSTLPIALPVTAKNMNYSVVVLAGWALFGAIYYYTVGKSKYQVPLTDLTITEDQREDVVEEK